MSDSPPNPKPSPPPSSSPPPDPLVPSHPKVNTSSIGLGETLLGVSILLLLTIIGVGVYIQQFNYDESFYQTTLKKNKKVRRIDLLAMAARKSRDGSSSSAPSPTPIPSPAVAAQSSKSDAESAPTSESVSEVHSGSFPPPPPHFKAPNPVESFDKDTLSEKINGKAELYLESGFIGLSAQRYFSETSTDVWYEILQYDMETPRNAFAVLSIQRRPQSPDSPIAPYSYSTENALYFMNGGLYYELVGSDSSTTLTQAITETAKSLMATPGKESLELPELTFLPTRGLLSGSQKLQLVNGFGFAPFDNLFSARYETGGSPLQLFVLIRKNAKEASKLADEYESFLIKAGGEKKTIEGISIPELRVVDVLGSMEFAFSRGRIVAGIHQAADVEAAKKLIVELYDKTGEIEK